MSIDLDWSKLDASFASSLIDALNGQLQSTPRPSFIGPIEITSFDFGSQPPVVELVDLRDVYRDFLEDDDDDNYDYEGGGGSNIGAERGFSRSSSAGQNRNRSNRNRDEDEDEYEWVSRRSARRGMAVEDPVPMYYHHLPPHVRYARGPASDVYSAPPEPAPAPLQPSSSSSLGPGATAIHSGKHAAFSMSSSAADTSSWRDSQQTRAHSSNLRSAHTTDVSSSAASSLSPLPLPHPHPDLADLNVMAVAMDPTPAPAPATVETTTAMRDNAGLTELAAVPATQDEPPTALAPPQPPAEPPADEHPNLQLHLLVSWHSDLRLTLTTSLRINYPSPLFMSLPIKLSVTGLVFDGELAVAYEGGRRVHLCVLDGLDPYGPSARRASGSQGSTPSDPEGDDAHAAKPLPVGQRLLPEIFIESELGQADKHVLKNVTRVEKFIQDVIRKTIEEEFVFPNFHTLVLR